MVCCTSASVCVCTIRLFSWRWYLWMNAYGVREIVVVRISHSFLCIPIFSSLLPRISLSRPFASPSLANITFRCAIKWHTCICVNYFNFAAIFVVIIINNIVMLCMQCVREAAQVAGARALFVYEYYAVHCRSSFACGVRHTHTTAENAPNKDFMWKYL